jgi:NAD(P)-dependent dehydrogenase (short-subunit alcohol dehydrogenase family)
VLAEQALADGNKVVATARKPESKLANLGYHYADRGLVLPLDVTNQEQVDSAVAQAVAKFGRIDVLVNNAGYGMAGAVEESAPDEFMPMFETNVFGLIRVTQGVLPHMREQRSGHIVNLSSIGGLVASPGFGIYNATKFAVEGLSESLAQELVPFGIKVTIIEPGPFRTDFLARSDATAKRNIVGYEPTAGKMRAYFADQNGKQKGDPQRAAKAIREVVESPDPPLRLLLGASTIPRLRGKFDAMNREVEAWAEVTRGADFPEGK